MGFRLANVNGRAALVANDQWYDLETVSDGRLGSDPMAALSSPELLNELSTTLATKAAGGALSDATLGAPVPRPRNSFAIGLNYKNHAAESAMELPENPLVFTKFPSCLVGPTATVEMRTDFCDYEAELVIVIGTGGKDIAPENAWNHVIGVTAGQDISDRMVQFHAKPPHFDLGKSFDTFGPLGPVLVSLDALAESGADRSALRLSTTVNGEGRQDDTTANLIFDVPALIAYISRVTTLSTGDIIFTGTPAGVGAATKNFLKDGDVIVTTIEGIGTMTNPCRRIGDL